jgi:hypothetical protein
VAASPTPQLPPPLLQPLTAFAAALHQPCEAFGVFHLRHVSLRKAQLLRLHVKILAQRPRRTPTPLSTLPASGKDGAKSQNPIFLLRDKVKGSMPHDSAFSCKETELTDAVDVGRGASR